MRNSNKGMFIDDIEIREIAERTGDDFAQIIADLDADPKTRKGYATWPAEARSKVNVEKYLALRAEQKSR